MSEGLGERRRLEQEYQAVVRDIRRIREHLSSGSGDLAVDGHVERLERLEDERDRLDERLCGIRQTSLLAPEDDAGGMFG